MSGGEARRAALARALAPEPDILLLDEPTNHLDLPAIEWLEAELAQSRSALVLISHDRRFLDNAVARHGLARPRRDAAARAGLRRLRGLARRGAGGGGARPPQARPQDRRRGALAALRRHGAAQAQHAPPRRAAATCASERREQPRRARRRSGSRVSEARSVRQAGDRGRQASPRASATAPIVRDFSTRIQRGDRLGIVGPNGAGKTTLLNLLTGALRARCRHGAARRQPGDGHARPAPRRASIPTRRWPTR